MKNYPTTILVSGELDCKTVRSEALRISPQGIIAWRMAQARHEYVLCKALRFYEDHGVTPKDTRPWVKLRRIERQKKTAAVCRDYGFRIYHNAKGL